MNLKTRGESGTQGTQELIAESFGKRGVGAKMFVGRSAQGTGGALVLSKTFARIRRHLDGLALEIRWKKLLRVIPRSDTEQHVRVYCHV
jgi:hypothetical protein